MCIKERKKKALNSSNVPGGGHVDLEFEKVEAGVREA